MEIGNVYMKIAGRDAGQIAVVCEVLKGGFVLIDGGVRRRKVNIKHLEPLGKKVDIKKGASTEDVLKALETIGFSIIKPVTKKKESKERPRKQRKTKAPKEKPKIEEKKKVEKKETNKEEKK